MEAEIFEDDGPQPVIQDLHFALQDELDLHDGVGLLTGTDRSETGESPASCL